MNFASLRKINLFFVLPGTRNHDSELLELGVVWCSENGTKMVIFVVQLPSRV